jgi:hypothetical protein
MFGKTAKIDESIDIEVRSPVSRSLQSQSADLSLGH